MSKPVDRWFNAVPIEDSEGNVMGGKFVEVDPPKFSTLAQEAADVLVVHCSTTGELKVGDSRQSSHNMPNSGEDQIGSNKNE